MAIKKATQVSPTPSSGLSAPDILEVKAGVFKNTCLELMDDVHNRDVQVIITKHGKIVAKLVSAGNENPSAFGFLRGTLLAQDDIVSPDFSEWGD